MKIVASETYYGKVFEINKMGPEVAKLPFTIKILLENLLVHYDGKIVTEEDINKLVNYASHVGEEVPFYPSRVILQDYTGVPLIVDLAAMRSKMAELSKDPKRVNPLIPVDLIIDHSVAVDYFGTSDSISLNMRREFERNRERYAFLKWAQRSFNNMRVIPPGKGIIHQINIEYLSKVVEVRNGYAFFDTVIGTDSHTTMVNGIGVLGWGVGGIEAEAVMLGQPYYIPIPEVVGVKLVNKPRPGVMPTDIALTVTEFLRKVGVVGKFVEFFGPGLKHLTAMDRAVIANMAPEYGSTVGFFPIDEHTLSYLRVTGRSLEHVKIVEEHSKLQGVFLNGQEPVYTSVYEFDLSRVEPCIAGPRNPDERIPLSKVKEVLSATVEEYRKKGALGKIPHGAVVLASITSCTNTSNPTGIIAAALLAKKAVEKGLSVKEYVKTSFSPGSRVVGEYLRALGLLPYLEALRFHVVGYGCMTCIGNSGPLPGFVEEEIKRHDLFTVGVISGNRNFEGRIHPLLKGVYLASPPLVIAYAIAGRIDVDFSAEPIGFDPNGRPVYLSDIWPSMDEVMQYVSAANNPEYYRSVYSEVIKGTDEWEALEVEATDVYTWPPSTYIRKPPWLDLVVTLDDIKGARVLLLLGDKITTDHISPAGAIPKDSDAGKFLISMGEVELSTYGARRGDHEVMLRGGFANPKLKNYLVDVMGGYTKYLPTGEVMSVYEASKRYKDDGTPLVIVAGKQYGSGSSRDWAAKVTMLLGVRAVLAESFERIHRSNLVAMGVLPLQLEKPWKELGLTGEEVFVVEGIKDIKPRMRVDVKAIKRDGSVITFGAIARVDTSVEVEYLKHGGIIPYVFKKLIEEK